MKPLIADILSGMASAVSHIQNRAVDYGFLGDVTDAEAVLDFIANTTFTLEDYSRIMADSQTISDAYSLVMSHEKSKAAQAEAVKLKRFDYEG